ncbi:hypothetical protein COZ55_01635 [archaeon CG_4_8_14_3_um_filter_38_5]|nr:MAG: hypothetical protein COS83_02490 [archaeon CG07_land_8_20_14_0_80_38_8]PIU88463.1 MAG: hypothetical protein COS64_03875 [archaeon CG06_land_8_20_14_3_00_37_11]PIX42909.1 MAG: hypothetical protein COZ55_01635 [archaeon CG_4_8_14_3_um_filter_38_5]
MFKVIIFDLIGVFSEHYNEYSIFKTITSYKGTAKSLKAYVGHDYNKLLTGQSTELEFWNKLKKATNTRKSVDSLKKDFLKHFHPLFTYETFEKAKNNFKTALCSNFVNSWWLYLKNKFKLSFDYEVLSSSLKIMKPSEQMYLSVPNFFKIRPSDCAYVSDEIEDIEIARNLGMKTIFIPGESKECRIADYYYKNVQELLEVLS